LVESFKEVKSFMKVLSSYFSSEKGVSLVELLAAIVILSIIIVTLLTMFVQSSRTNSFSKNIMDATYVAETHMEEIYNVVIASTTYDNASATIVSKGYTLESKTTVNAFYGKSVTGHYVSIELVPTSGNSLVKVRVKVYKDQTRTNKEAQMEMLLAWKK
jgi:prepilin-type N-terminal cleavage/methylation domain-containing protein